MMNEETTWRLRLLVILHSSFFLLHFPSALPENVNYAVKSGYLLSFLEVFADGQLKLKEANGKEIKFEEVVEKAKQAAVLVLVH